MSENRAEYGNMSASDLSRILKATYAELDDAKAHGVFAAAAAKEALAREGAAHAAAVAKLEAELRTVDAERAKWKASCAENVGLLAAERARAVALESRGAAEAQATGELKEACAREAAAAAALRAEVARLEAALEAASADARIVERGHTSLVRKLREAHATECRQVLEATERQRQEAEAGHAASRASLDEQWGRRLAKAEAAHRVVVDELGRDLGALRAAAALMQQESADASAKVSLSSSSGFPLSPGGGDDDGESDGGYSPCPSTPQRIPGPPPYPPSSAESLLSPGGFSGGGGGAPNGVYALYQANLLELGRCKAALRASRTVASDYKQVGCGWGQCFCFTLLHFLSTRNLARCPTLVAR